MYAYNQNGKSMLCGVDEAGRGPVMGPLVVGTVYSKDDEGLIEIGVRDSKKLTPKMRERMYEEIISCVDHWDICVLTAAELDMNMKKKTLNEIEMGMFAELARKWDCDTVIVDCPEINESSFEYRLSLRIGKDVEVIARNKADDTYPIVSAASIVAKVNRDRMMEDICEEFGMDVGSGYPSDHYTMDFIKEWIEKNGNTPPHVRTSWEPIKQLMTIRKNTKIDDW